MSIILCPSNCLWIMNRNCKYKSGVLRCVIKNYQFAKNCNENDNLSTFAILIIRWINNNRSFRIYKQIKPWVIATFIELLSFWIHWSRIKQRTTPNKRRNRPYRAVCNFNCATVESRPLLVNKQSYMKMLNSGTHSFAIRSILVNNEWLLN